MRFSCIPVLLCAAYAALAGMPAGAQAFEAGAAKVDITPPLGTPMIGVPERMDLGATSVHTPLYARALFLDDGATPVLLVTVDIYAIPPALRARVLKFAPSIVPREQVILVATHTHSGPGGMEPDLPRRIEAGRYLPELIEQTAVGIAESMRLAVEARRRAAIGYATAKQTTLSRHRAINQGPIDEQVGVVRVDDADGNAIAILANFSMRPDLSSKLAPFAFSSDFPGAFCDALEDLTAEGCIGFFLNGAAADQILALPGNAEGWAQAESLAKLLAASVKGAANQIAGTQVPLALYTAELTLPPILAPARMPDSTPIQHLEIGGLLVTFLPATPGVRVAMDLRARALARGYNAQFTVGPANAYLGDLVARADFAQSPDPPFQHPFGPGAADWIAVEVEALMSRGDAASARPVVPPSETTAIPGGTHLRLAGSPYAMGLRWGRAFQGMVHDAYLRDVAGPLSRGEFRAESPVSEWWPPLLDPSVAALPVLVARVRPALTGLPPGGQDFIEGLAEGAEQPFDAVWLAWNAHEMRSGAASGGAPCIALSFAVLGDMAGADQVLLGHSMAGMPRAPLIAASFVPEQGQPLVQIAEAGDAGFLAGVNGAGVALCIDRFPGDDAANGAQPFLALKLRALLFEADNFDKALARLRALNGARGYRFLLSGPAATGFAVAFVEFGGEIRVAQGKEGLVLDTAEPIGMTSRSGPLETRVAERLGTERIVGVPELTALLTGGPGDEMPRDALWTADTQYAVIIVPKQGRMHVAFRTPGGAPSDYAVLSIADAVAAVRDAADE